MVGALGFGGLAMDAQHVAISPGTTTTLAGTVSSTCTSAATCGDGGLATSAKFGAAGVYTARLDSSGDVFVSDGTEFVIRVVYEGGSFAQSLIAAAGGANPATVGDIYRVAGTYATTGATGDNGPAASATVSGVRGMFIDSFNNIWLSDSTNNRVRVIYSGGSGNPAAALIAAESQTATAGNIYTIAGNGTTAAGTSGSLANAVGLNSPRGLYVSSAGDVYVLDEVNNLVRVVYNGGTIAKQYITLENGGVAPTSSNIGDIYTVAGTGASTLGSSGTYSEGDGSLATAASLNLPISVSFDASNNMYIAEYGGDRIRKVSYQTGLISLIAGAAASGSSVATACTATSNSIYVVSTVCGDGGPATSATFNQLRALWIDGGGAIYVADGADNRIRKIDTAGNIATLAGNGASTSVADPGNSLTDPTVSTFDLSLDSNGNIYIADSNGDRVREISVIGTTLTYTAVGPGGIASQLATVYNNSATSLTLSGLTTLSAPYAQTVPSGYGTDCTSTSVINPGMSCSILISASPTLTTAQTATEAVASNGTNNSGAASISLTATVKSSADSGSVTSVVASAYDIAPSQSVTFTSTTQNSTASTNNGSPIGGTVTFLDGTTSLGTGSVTNGIATFTTTAIATTGTHSITASYNKTPTSNGFPASVSSAITITVTAATTTTLAVTPSSLVADKGATVTLMATVAASSCTGTVNFYSGTVLQGSGTLSSGTATLTTTSLPSGTDSVTAVYAGSASCASSSSSATTVTISSQNIWVANGNSTVSAFTQAGIEISPSYGESGGGAGVVFDSTGNAYSVNSSGNTLTRFSSTGTPSATTAAAAGGMSGPVALAVTGTGYVWVADSTGNSLSYFNGGTLAAVSSTAFFTNFTGGGLSSPSALAIDTSGNVWVANAGNSSVTEFVGAADPVVTPLSVATQNATQGVKP